eukprot:gene8012-1241_t
MSAAMDVDEGRVSVPYSPVNQKLNPGSMDADPPRAPNSSANALATSYCTAPTNPSDISSRPQFDLSTSPMPVHEDMHEDMPASHLTRTTNQEPSGTKDGLEGGIKDKDHDSSPAEPPRDGETVKRSRSPTPEEKHEKPRIKLPKPWSADDVNPVIIGAAPDASMWLKDGALPKQAPLDLRTLSRAQVLEVVAKRNTAANIDRPVHFVLAGVVENAKLIRPELEVYPFSLGGNPRHTEVTNAWKRVGKVFGRHMVTRHDENGGAPGKMKKEKLGKDKKIFVTVTMFGELSQSQEHFNSLLATFLGMKNPIRLPLLYPGAPVLDLKQFFLDVMSLGGYKAVGGLPDGWSALANSSQSDAALAPVMEQIYFYYLLPLEDVVPKDKEARFSRLQDWMEAGNDKTPEIPKAVAVSATLAAATSAIKSWHEEYGGGAGASGKATEAGASSADASATAMREGATSATAVGASSSAVMVDGAARVDAPRDGGTNGLDAKDEEAQGEEQETPVDLALVETGLPATLLWPKVQSLQAFILEHRQLRAAPANLKHVQALQAFIIAHRQLRAAPANLKHAPPGHTLLQHARFLLTSCPQVQSLQVQSLQAFIIAHRQLRAAPANLKHAPPALKAHFMQRFKEYSRTRSEEQSGVKVVLSLNPKGGYAPPSRIKGNLSLSSQMLEPLTDGHKRRKFGGYTGPTPRCGTCKSCLRPQLKKACYTNRDRIVQGLDPILPKG